MTHTQGPWTQSGDKIVSASQKVGCIAHIYEKGEQMWENGNPVGFSDNAQRDANARLIAAAPGIIKGDGLHDITTQADRAIAKAEGR